MTLSQVALLPKHVAIIMDGNGRWATEKGLLRTAGHQAGLEALKDVVNRSIQVGVEILTIFAFSSENWERPKSEVNSLLKLFLEAFDNEFLALHEKGVRLTFIGQIDAFPTDIQTKMRAAEQSTANNTNILLNIAANYGGRWDIKCAVQKICKKIESGAIDINNIELELISENLCLASLPEPDLLIRTGGEKRLSNYLLWQLAYTELYFCDTKWPDFSIEEFDKALQHFAAIERRYGKVSPQAGVKYSN